MKPNKILSIVLISASTLVRAQEIQNRSVEPFYKMEISGALNVYYTHSDSLSLSVKAKTGEIERVETRVENGTLFISNKGRFTGSVSVYVKNNRLKQLQASGATDFKSTNALKGDSLVLSLSSSSSAKIGLNAMQVKSVQSGASLLTLSGTATHFQAELSGASSLKAYDLVSKSTDIVATGASSSKIYVTDKLKANASGASNIRIKGEVKDISAEASSASSITRILDQEKSDGDSTIYDLKRRRIIIIEKEKDGLSVTTDSIEIKHYDKNDFKHWHGFLIGVNGYMSAPGNIDVPAKYNYMELNYSRSFNFQFNIIERQFNIVKNNFKIITGLGFDYHSYELANKTTLNPDSAFTWGTTDSTKTFNYVKNRLRNTYLQVPLLLEFNTSNNPHKTFHLAFGVVGEYLIASRTKQLLEQDKYEIKKVRKDNYNMSPFAAKAHVNIGYRGVTVFGEYNLTPLFQPGKGPDLHPFTVGIRIVPVFT